ncbi:hypothetical protein LSUE1_G006301 [Lachnellula suecica]|uniref:PAS domain-containing protein n=1 Tax=Lachnellula suecica TaxID=602035 RepID=A0A8T9BVW3_9HELO|nr:hypothetical protein LSUE1_G006301 [Lachnellula suecica]
METTFMTIHNLTPDANVMFASESIVDILGYHSGEVIGRSCFDYFHPDEVPFARNIHSRGVQLDKAAVLHYARIRGRDGQWIGCECVFTIVYEVLVACTSIYRGDAKNERRAVEAPAIRRLFASSPKDPRYHMLEHLSSKFRTPPQESLLEPRAAIILNRFTRTLTVMYATNAISSILGVTPEQFIDKSFYECIQENCLPEAIRCLESAKSNDSIAYLRFWYRHPGREEDRDEQMREASQSSDSEDGGVELNSHMDIDSTPGPAAESSTAKQASRESEDPATQGISSGSRAEAHRTSSGESTDLELDSPAAIFDHSQTSRSSTSSLEVISPEVRRRARPSATPQPPAEPFELEAVISCTSDGLVVILRRARPIIPQLQQILPPVQAFAPWGVNPIRPHLFQPDQRNPFQHGFAAPQFPVGGPPQDDFMRVIREVGVFAWSLVGINGNIAEYSHGTPYGESQPEYIPVWDPYAEPRPEYAPPENQAALKWVRELTNEPADGNKVPFQHPRQEEILRNQLGVGSGPMGSDHPASSAHDRLAGILPNPVGHFEINQQAQINNGFQGQIGWSAVPSQNVDGPSTTQGQGPSERGRSDRNLWY